MKIDIRFWLKFSIINLLIVGALGVLMRYKIGFEFPYFSQKNIQHAHSHFAFAGWITHTLYVLLINFLQSKIILKHEKHYRLALIFNLICAYGMLLSFSIQGYGFISIALSMGTILVACSFAYYFIQDLKSIDNHHPSILWFKSALWFNILSSLGTFYLAYMMSTRHFNENMYLASVYFYLHFQYNGFFIFTCMGLIFSKINKVLPSYEYDKRIFILFFTSFFPAYFLSVLWAKIPVWLYIIVVVAAIVQIIAWIMFISKVRKCITSKIYLSKLLRYLFLSVAIAFSIKLLLQLGSTIPIVSKLAFGFRPIVIAYLHLVLLAVISVFILAFAYSSKLMRENKWSVYGLILFVIGVLLNELALAVQGIASFSYLPIPKINETLFIVSLVLLGSLITLVISQTKIPMYDRLKSTEPIN